MVFRIGLALNRVRKKLIFWLTISSSLLNRSGKFNIYDKILSILIAVMLFGCNAKVAKRPQQASRTILAQDSVMPKHSSDGKIRELILLLQIDEKGKLCDVSIKKPSGNKRFDEEAIAAVKTWHFSPAKNEKGEVIKSTLPIAFALE